MHLKYIVFFREEVGTLEESGGEFTNIKPVFKCLALYDLFTVKTLVCKTSLRQQNCFERNIQCGDRN